MHALPRPPVVATALFVAVSLAAQESRPTARPVVVTATRSPQDPFELPYSTTQLGSPRITGEQQARSTPEMLKEIPGVSVQKTAHGQGSPKIRGQTGFQTLLLVDGVRMNDSTWRSGNVEYWSHVDPYSVAGFELVRGPGSVLWGSDASFGVGHAVSKHRTSFAPGFHHDHGLSLRYASAEDSYVTHAQTAGNAGEFGWHAGATFKDFGDLTAGRNIGLLPYTGYTEGDGDVQLTRDLGGKQRLTFAAQVVSLSDVPRTHSTTAARTWRGTQVGTDLKREHDHRRQLYYGRYEAEGLLGIDGATFTLGWKDRYEREERTPSNGRTQFNVTEVGTAVATAQFQHQAASGRWAFGADYYRDSVDSDFREYNADGSLRGTRNRGPVAGDATYDLLGAYVQDEIALGDDVRLTLGARFTYAEVDAEQVDVPGDSVVFDDVHDSWTAFTPTARVLWRATPATRWYFGFAEGFRTPNLSDLTRFDVGRSGEQEVPASGLDPEHYYTFELGGRFDDGQYAIEATPWYTVVRDQIGRYRTGGTVNGLPEVSKANVGDGWLAGIEVSGAASLAALELDEWRVFGFVDYVAGEIDAVGNSGQPLPNEPVTGLPPLSGTLGLRWEHPTQRTGAEVFSRMAWHKHVDSYSNDDRNDPQRVPPGGLPGYATLNLRGWHRVGKHFEVSLAVENLTDVDYRIMSSGLNEPGTNVIMTLAASF